MNKLKRLPRPSAGVVIATIALVVALQGTAAARVLIGTLNLKTGSVTSAKIKDGTIQKVDIARGVLPALDAYTKKQADGRFVNIVPGTLNQAPNAAALQGHPATDFLTPAQGDQRYAPAAGALDGGQYVKGQDGLERITRLALNPQGSPTATLLTLPNLGTVKVQCNAAATDGVGLSISKDDDAAAIGAMVQRTVEPGGTTANANTALTTFKLSNDAGKATHNFEAATGTGGQGRYVIQLSRVTNNKHYMATVTVSTMYSDTDINPGQCTAYGQFLEASEAAN